MYFFRVNISENKGTYLMKFIVDMGDLYTIVEGKYVCKSINQLHTELLGLITKFNFNNCTIRVEIDWGNDRNVSVKQIAKDVDKTFSKLPISTLEVWYQFRTHRIVISDMFDNDPTHKKLYSIRWIFQSLIKLIHR